MTAPKTPIATSTGTCPGVSSGLLIRILITKEITAPMTIQMPIPTKLFSIDRSLNAVLLQQLYYGSEGRYGGRPQSPRHGI